MDVRDARVVLGIPHTGDFRPYFFDTAMSLMKNTGTIIVRVERKPVDMARNMVVETVLEHYPDTTHIFFMDSDQMFPPGALQRLLERDLDIVGGTYFARTETPIPHAYRFSHEDEDEKGFVRQWYRTLGAEFAKWWNGRPDKTPRPHAWVYPDWDGSLVKCDALATGCLLVKVGVFRAMAGPWFECWPGSVGGEDFDFCRKAREAGFQVWGDFSVQCGHEAQMVFVGAEDFAETYALGTPDEYNFIDPVLVEAGPNGRRVRLGADAANARPDSDTTGLTLVRRPLQRSSEVA